MGQVLHGSARTTAGERQRCSDGADLPLYLPDICKWES